MAERIISPGVFTREIDQSFLAGGIAQIGAAIVGPTVKGPALVPTQITSLSQFQNTFGSFTDDSYVPFVVKEYLEKGGNVITVTRLLYEDGYQLSNGVLAVVAQSGSTKVVSHVLHPTYPVTTTGATNLFEDSVLEDAGSGSFAIKLSGSYGVATGTDATAISFGGSFLVAEGVAISASITPSSNKYVTKVFTADPKSIDYPVYVQYATDVTGLFANLGQVTMSLEKIASFKLLQDYQSASTPWVTSQKVGSTAKNLFKFHTLSHGTSVNYDVKVAIQDLVTSNETNDPDGYGSFTVQIRRVNPLALGIENSPYGNNSDTDSSPALVEFRNVNLNPASSRYIARVIGDRYQTVTDNGVVVINGDYPNTNPWIRVEVDPGVANKTNSKTLIPFGFRSMSSPIPMASGSLNLTATSYVTSQVVAGQFSSLNFHGFNFASTNNAAYLAPTPTSGSVTGSNADFYIGDVSQSVQVGYPSATAPYSGSLEAALTGGTFQANVALSTRKFIVPFQGGFDGARPNLPKYAGTYIADDNTFGFDCSTSTATGTTAYNKAFTVLSNTDYYDMNLLLTPGIIDSLHGSVTLSARQLAEGRQDTFYVMDSNPLTDSILAVASQVQTLDSNYTATYWPWVRITNPSNNVPLWVPPSVVVPGVLSYNDAVAQPWYAPAGLNRGGLTSVTDTYIRLLQSDRDTLYQARVNPIANFVNDGVCIWGQKTLQARPSALDRVNVRRLLIAVKKFIASSTRYLVFEQNTASTRARFLSITNPYLEQVRAQQGLYAFRVIMDETNNTPDVIDQNILYGQLFLQPTRTAEFIVLDFNIQPTGASFPV
jgi:hypothetical protein